MLKDTFLSRLDALRLAMKHPAHGGSGGMRRSKRLGSSAEFSDFREYVAGDDIRRLDWNAYARFDKLFMKLFMDEQEAFVSILIDGSASMAEKRAETVRAAEALSYLALGGGDRLRITWLGEGECRQSALLAGRSAYPAAAEFISGGEMRGRISLPEALQKMPPLPKGVSILLSDGYFDQGMGQTLDFLRYARQEVLLVQLLSAQEMNPTLQGALRLRDAEGAGEVDLLLDGAALRQYQATLHSFLAQTREDCLHRGAAYMLLCDDAPFEERFLPALARSGMSVE